MASDPAAVALILMRALARVLLALLVVVTTTSAWLRLAQTGLSCDGAPDCYATRAVRADVDGSTSAAVARTLHRLAASAAGAVIVALLFFGSRGGTRGERVAIVALLLLAAGLASLGRHTPSGLPVVTLANLGGGFAMLGVAAWLAARLAQPAFPPSRLRALRPWVWLGIALVAAEVALGGMIAVRHAAFACPTFPACDGTLWPRAVPVEAFHPLHELPPPASAAARADAGRQAVVQMHRLLAVPVLLALVGIALRASAAGGGLAGRALLPLALLQGALGAAQALIGPTLLAATAHNVAAALIVTALAALVARGGAAARD